MQGCGGGVDAPSTRASAMQCFTKYGLLQRTSRLVTPALLAARLAEGC